jgi:hypothetical protein
MMHPLFRYERKESERGRCLVATTNIREGQLIFVERPLLALQSTGNVHEGVIVPELRFTILVSQLDKKLLES